MRCYKGPPDRNAQCTFSLICRQRKLLQANTIVIRSEPLTWDNEQRHQLPNELTYNDLSIIKSFILQM